MNAYAPKQPATIRYEHQGFEITVECSGLAEVEVAHAEILRIVLGEKRNEAVVATPTPPSPQNNPPPAQTPPTTTPNFFGQQQQQPQQASPQPNLPPQIPPAQQAATPAQPATGGLVSELAVAVAEVFCKDAWQPQLAKTITLDQWQANVVNYLTTSFTSDPGKYINFALSKPGDVYGNDPNIVEFVNNNAQYLVGMIQ